MSFHFSIETSYGHCTSMSNSNKSSLIINYNKTTDMFLELKLIEIRQKLWVHLKLLDMFLFSSQIANFVQSCPTLSCFVSHEYQLVVHVVPSKPALRSEQHRSSVRQEEDAHLCFCFCLSGRLAS